MISQEHRAGGHVFGYAVVAALAGFLFGFDTIVISGAEQEIQTIWRLSGTMHGLAMSAALWGTVVGSLVGGWPTERFGRRATLLWIGILYFVSAVGSGMAPEMVSFMIARFIGGVGVGIATVAAPLYISEISPAASRGRLAGMFQFNIVFGILIAFLSNFLIGLALGDEGSGWTAAWRWMLGVEAIPALLYTVFCFRIPESPRWLIVHGGDRAGGIAVFKNLNPHLSEQEVEALADSVSASAADDDGHRGFWTRRLSYPILLAFLIAFFNQLSGINAILYFAPRLLNLAGIERALLAAVLIGVTNLVFTYVGLWLIDKLGRKTLLLIGSLGYIASLAVCAYAFLGYPAFKVVSRAIDLSAAARQIQELDDPASPLSDADRDQLRSDFQGARQALQESTGLEGYRGESVTISPQVAPADAESLAEEIKRQAAAELGPMSMVVLISIIAFIAAHAVGQGAVIWVFISEIFPNRYRSSGQALGSFTHWIFAALITLFFPVAITSFDAGAIFAFFCFMMCLQLVWVLTIVPETKGVSLEEMERKLGIK